MNRSIQLASRPQYQRGNTLIIAIVLLLLVALSTLFAVNVGTFEQRTSANDLRTKMVAQVAEGALSQGVAYFDLNRDVFEPQAATNEPNPAFWQLCQAADTSFPCGAAPAARRATMFRYVGGTVDIDGGGLSDLERRMVPIEATRMIGPVGANFTTIHGAGALLCMVEQVVPGTPLSATNCTDEVDPELADAPLLLTVVAIGGVPGEGASSAVMQTVGIVNEFSDLPGVPPIVAAGGVDISGGIQVVANANSAGVGVPISVWTRRNLTKTGTPNTCYADEFFRFGAQQAKPPTFYGTTNPVVICDSCKCDGEHTLSYQSSGNLQLEGIDLLDIDGNDGVNRDVRPTEFPCDLFEYIFSKKSWRDTDGDNFCETRITQSIVAEGDNQTYTVGADEAYLYERAKFIIPTAANLAKVPVSKRKTCADLYTTTVSGIWWAQQKCDIGSGQSVSHPDNPVILVMDGGDISIQGRLFGLLFLRTNDPGPLNPTTGGTVSLDMNAGAVIYGAMVMQGVLDTGNGTAAVVFNSDILDEIGKGRDVTPTLSLPGSWTDRVGFSF